VGPTDGRLSLRASDGAMEEVIPPEVVIGLAEDKLSLDLTVGPAS
jgi:hypothetical protein